MSLELANSPFSRRSIRYVVAGALILAGSLYLLVFPPTNISWDHLTTYGLSPGGSSSSILPAATFLERFVQSFPSLREENAFDRDGERENFYMSRLAQGREDFDWPTTTKLFVFGDSFSSTGSNYVLNGVGNGHPEHLEGRVTDLKWADYLYQTFKDPQETQYWNFARDGATIDSSIVPPRLAESGSFETQLDEFRTLFSPMPGPSQVDWNSEDSLFIILLGINDVALYDLGARNFLFFTIAALDDAPKYSLPSHIGYNISTLLRTACASFNEQLEPAVAHFERTSPGANAFVFDWDNLYRVITEWPEVFGLTDCKRYIMTIKDKQTNQGRMGFCYQDPSHLTWSIAHLSHRPVRQRTAFAAFKVILARGEV